MALRTTGRRVSDARPGGTAPFYADVADGPASGRAVWIHAEDGVRLRLGLWPLEGARGTVLLMPGRTEYIEKYGRVAADLAQRGYAVISVDWRGQGLSDRLGPVRLLGHVRNFKDFQKDVAAIFAALPGLASPSLPLPHCLIAHSMAGAIALRALIDGLPQKAGIRCACFSGPMWDIAFAPRTRPWAGPVSTLACAVGLGTRFAPGTAGETYVSRATFDGNRLTTDPDMWDYMRRQIATYPDLSLSGPSMRWLHGALREARAFLTADLPDLPVHVFLGSEEQIVSQQAMQSLCARWPSATLHVLEGKQHEVLMDDTATRGFIFDTVVALAEAHKPPPRG